MTVKELKERLEKYPNDSKVVMYTSCGPDSIEDVAVNRFNEIVLESGKCCEHLIDDDCVENIKRNNKETDSSNRNIPTDNGVKGMLKGIICLIFGHDWVDYNEHCYICSRCMEVAPKG